MIELMKYVEPDEKVVTNNAKDGNRSTNAVLRAFDVTEI